MMLCGYEGTRIGVCGPGRQQEGETNAKEGCNRVRSNYGLLEVPGPQLRGRIYEIATHLSETLSKVKSIFLKGELQSDSYLISISFFTATLLPALTW